MTMTPKKARARAAKLPTEGGTDLAVEVAAEAAPPEIVKMAAVGGTDGHLDRGLAHQGQLGVVQGLARQREVGRDDPLAQGVGQGIAHGHHVERRESHEDPVPGADPSPVPVPETGTETETGIKAVGGDQGAGHMTGHVIVGRDPVQDHHTREGGATVLARGHAIVIVTVNDDQRQKPWGGCVCVFACVSHHYTAAATVGSLEW